MTAKQEAFIALNRFGLGAAVGDLDRVARDPRGWLTGQLADPAAIPPELSGFASGSDHARDLVNAIQDKSIEKEKFQQEARALYVEEVGQRTLAAIHTQAPLVERLTRFWSNHFTVSITGGARWFPSGQGCIRPGKLPFCGSRLPVGAHSSGSIYLRSVPIWVPNGGLDAKGNATASPAGNGYE